MLYIVMAALDPAIYPLPVNPAPLDARLKAGHDDQRDERII